MIVLCLLYYVYLHRPLRYERVHRPLCEVADAPFHIQVYNIYNKSSQDSVIYNNVSTLFIVLTCDVVTTLAYYWPNVCYAGPELSQH